MQLNKLSIEYLAEAFTQEEAKGAWVFAVFGRQEVIKTLQWFMKGMSRSQDGATCFGATYIVSDRVPEGYVVLGARVDQFTHMKDFEVALATGLSERPKFLPGERAVWGQLLSLV